MKRKSIPSGYVIRPYKQEEYQADYCKAKKRIGIFLIISGLFFVREVWLILRSLELSSWASQTQSIGVLSVSGTCVILFASMFWTVKNDLRNKVWVIDWRDQSVGYLQLRPKVRAYVLTIIFIDPQHRRQGLGRALIQQAAQDVQQKIYVRCAKGLIPFYTRCGFVRFSKTQVPKPLRPYMFVLSHLVS